MKKIKDMLRRIGTAGLAAIMLTAQMPVTAFAEEIAQPQEIVVSDEAIPAKVQMEDVLPIETDGDTAIAETDGFSLYTVEFTYDSKQYVLPGGSEVALSEILDTVGLTGEVSDVEVSDESLFSAKKCKTADGNTPENDEEGNSIEDENGTWFVFAHQAFSSEEWMKVTIGGVVYEITVTDEATEVTTWDGLKTALSAGGEVKLTQDITAGETDTHLLVPKGTTATLDLNGHTIDYSASNEAQIVDGNGAEGGLNISRNGAIVVLGTLTIKASGTGGTITGGTGESAKASLASYGNVTMQGGTLKGMVYLGDEDNQGYGGINMTGGTIDGQMFIDSKSSFSMQDGCKVENTLITCKGTFTMTGGIISGHNVSQVVLVGGTFTMSGGMISGTEVEDCVVETNHIFTMTGGEVSGTGKNGGIFSINPASFHISGAPKISSVYLSSDSVNKALVNIDGPLTSGASIPVISSQKPTADTPVVITSGLKEKGGVNAESYFSNETAGTSMVKNSDGELELQRGATEWDALQTLLSQGGTVTLTKDYTATSVNQKLTIPASTQVTIDLSGHKIDGSKLTTEYVFYIEGAPVNTPYSTLTITDTDSGTGGEILCGNNGAVELGGGFLTFNMQGGTITSSGNPIIRTGSAGSFNMSGGTINGKITDSDTPVPGSVN